MPTVNGINYSQSQSQLIYAGTTSLSFDDISFGIKRDIELGTSNSNEVTDITIGADMPTQGSIEMSKSSLDSLLGFSANGFLTDVPPSLMLLIESTPDGKLKKTTFSDVFWNGYDYKTSGKTATVNFTFSKAVVLKIS